MGGYLFALRQAAALESDRRIDDVRWSLSALDPAGGRVRCGAFAASDGADVPYRLWLAKKPRAALLLLHGCCDYSGAFDAIGPKLARNGFSVLAYDQRGFGATESRGRWTSQERIVRDVADAIAFFRTRAAADLPLFIVGESMGGAVAIHAVAIHGNANIAGLVLVAPGALASAFRRSIYRWVLNFFRAIVGEFETVVERIDSSDLSTPAAIRLLGDPMVMRGINASLLDGVIALAHSSVEAARHVVVPTLTLVGGKDDLLRRDCIHRLHSNLAGPRAWAGIEGGPHLLLHWKRGQHVLRTARRWIERHL